MAGNTASKAAAPRKPSAAINKKGTAKPMNKKGKTTKKASSVEESDSSEDHEDKPMNAKEASPAEESKSSDDDEKKPLNARARKELQQKGVWRFRKILAKKGDNYLIDWSRGLDGREYNYSWLHKSDVGTEGIDEWNERSREEQEKLTVKAKKGNLSIPEEDRMTFENL